MAARHRTPGKKECDRGEAGHRLLEQLQPLRADRPIQMVFAVFSPYWAVGYLRTFASLLAT
jgi:hypothetical protein